MTSLNDKSIIYSSFNFKQYYDINKYFDPQGFNDIATENYTEMLPKFYKTIFNKIHYNKYNKNIINRYDIHTYKLLFMNKKNKNNFINIYIKNKNYNKLKPLQQICSLKKLSKSYLLTHNNFHYYIHHIIAEIYIKIKDYNKSIEHYLFAKKFITKHQNNINIFKYEQKYNINNDNTDKYICINSKNVLDISFNIGLLHLYINKFDQSLEYFIHPHSYHFHKKSNQIIIVLLLKYYYKLLHNNTIKIAVYLNQHIVSIIQSTNKIEIYKKHYVIGFLYYILHEAPNLYLAIKHLEESAVYYSDANQLLGNIYNETGYYYNIYKSLTYYNSVKKLCKKKYNKLSITLNKLYLKNDIDNYKKFNKFKIYFKYLYYNIIQNWKYNNYNINTIKKFNKLHIYFKYLYSKIIMNWIHNYYYNYYIMNYISNIFYNYWFSKIIRNWRINWLFN